jgi:hypothetical protein
LKFICKRRRRDEDDDNDDAHTHTSVESGLQHRESQEVVAKPGNNVIVKTPNIEETDGVVVVVVVVVSSVYTPRR